MGCFGECWDVGPPPDSILNLPPPPIPNFLQRPISDLLLNSTPCSATQLCESSIALNRVPTDSDGDYVELPRKDLDSWSVSNIDDTWLLVLVASSIGVLLLGALLAMFLLKCREMSIFDKHDYTTRDHRQMKNHPQESRDCIPVTSMNGNNKIVHPSDSDVMYQNGSHPALNNDNRMVWAALTPHGTQHFISENYPRDLIDYCEPAVTDGENHYETVDNINHHYYPYNKGLVRIEKSSFDNIGFVDYDYEDPIPLIENYQLNNMENKIEYAILGNTDMRCANIGYSNNTSPLRYSRPMVSSPTRIEHPNLPPLNLYPHKGGTLKRGSINYRSSIDTLPKYGL